MNACVVCVSFSFYFFYSNCYKTELQAYCDGAGGVVWNEDFCFIPGYHTVIGPVCWEEFCFAGSLNPQCDSMGGTALADRWCVVEGCDRTGMKLL
jgi:hypothetical protein